MKQIIYIFIILCTHIFSASVYAIDSERYVTIVNPVRSRIFWRDADSVKKQIESISGRGIAATWLFQYSTLTDQNAVELFRELPSGNEFGIFLEIDENLANDALVPYILGEGDWARADKVFLSGYTPVERKRLIDKLFFGFKNAFGYFPSSVGAWYIDSISLNYMADKYQIKAVLDVSDQYQTDGYGSWGKPWGTPYYPSRLNSLIPAQTIQNKLDIVKIQWAQRDPMLGYGLTVVDSTYSLQANDYVGHHGLNISYFETLAKDYLFSFNPLTQITIGLEVGQEGASYIDEFERQLETLIRFKEEANLKFVTVESFSTEFKKMYPENFPSFIIGGSHPYNPQAWAYWISTPYYRIGFQADAGRLKVRDFRSYDETYIFPDIAGEDKNYPLKRLLPACIDELLDKNSQDIITEIATINIDRNGNDIELSATTENGEKNTILLQKDKIFLNKEQIFNVFIDDNINHRALDFLKRLIIDQTERKADTISGGIRFSYINGQYYLGWASFPNKLVGVGSIFPFIGTYEFPFQTLVRFRTFPSIDIVSLAVKDLVRYNNKCTIKP